MTQPLSPFSYFVLAVIGRGALSGPELVAKISDGAPFFWTGADSHVLRTARGLADKGYLRTRSEPAKTRPRTVFELTDQGLAAFREWQARPSRFPEIHHEAAIRLWATELGDEDTVLQSLRALRDELPALRAIVDSHDEDPDFPERDRALRLNQSLARRLIDAHLEWINEVEAEYATEPNAETPQS